MLSDQVSSADSLKLVYNSVLRRQDLSQTSDLIHYDQTWYFWQAEESQTRLTDATQVEENLHVHITVPVSYTEADNDMFTW